MLSLIKIKDIHQCEDTDHVYVIFRTSPRETHIVRAGNLVPAYTMLVTPATGKSDPGCVFHFSCTTACFTRRGAISSSRLTALSEED